MLLTNQQIGECFNSVLHNEAIDYAMKKMKENDFIQFMDSYQANNKSSDTNKIHVFQDEEKKCLMTIKRSASYIFEEYYRERIAELSEKLISLVK